MIEYTVRLADLRRHLFEVDCRVDGSFDGRIFEFASWIPGSYLLREYARHVVSAAAYAADGSALPLEKLAHNQWRCGGSAEPVTLRLSVYALDQSVRGAWLDMRRAYFNGPCLFARPLGVPDGPVRLKIEPSRDEATSLWHVATAMHSVDTDARGFGEYRAADYDELLDQPFEIGTFERVDFTVKQTPHSLVVAGSHDGDLLRVAEDLSKLCATQVDFFGEPAPFDRYYFLCLAVTGGYGGLEHCHSSSLMFSRDNLPLPGDASVRREYQRMLSLASHEYFHAWHVKRTRPAALQPYRLTERNYTRLLWVFEGITSYYQDRFLLRCGLIDAQAYLSKLAETVSNVLRVPGRRLQSLSESSFDAWDKLYKPEANSPNAGVSYYSKGAVVALALDLSIRARHESMVSLDNVVQKLWQRFGSQDAGVPEDGFEALVGELAGGEFADFFDAYVRGTEDPPLEDLFSLFGVEMQLRPERGTGMESAAAADCPRLWLGVATKPADGGVQCTTVFDGGPAQRAGINPGDTLVALGRRRVSADSLERVVNRFAVGETLEAAVFREDELLELPLTFEAAPALHCHLSLADSSDEKTLLRRRHWLYEA